MSAVLDIVRLEPGDQQLTIEVQFSSDSLDPSAYTIQFTAQPADSSQDSVKNNVPATVSTLTLTGLANGKDYRLQAAAYPNGSDQPTAVAAERLFRVGWIPGTVVNYIHPEDYTYDSSGRSTASPCMLRLPNGTLLASHDIYWGRGGQNITKVFQSHDDGNSWSYLSTIHPCFWGKLFVHNGRLYKMGTSTEYGALMLFESLDWGQSWSEPIVIIPGGSREQGGPHQAPVPVVNHAGRLWTAVEHGSWSTGGHDAGVVSVGVDTDLMDPDNWAVTPFLPYDPQWPGAIRGGKPGVLEGNVVVGPDGQLYNVLRYHTRDGHPDYGRAVILRVDADNPRAPLQFHKIVDFPGSMSKFTIHFDPQTQLYYALVNRVTTDNVSQRNILTLTSSPDLEHWTIRRDVLNYEDNGYPEDMTKVGFQYVDWFFEGSNILALSRTALNGAYNFHNANHITFHVFRNYSR